MSRNEKIIMEYCAHRLRSHLEALFLPDNPLRQRLEKEIDDFLEDLYNDAEDLT